MTACGACTPRATLRGSFRGGPSSSSLTRRPGVCSKPGACNTRPVVNRTTTASTAWTLDGPGCAGARSGNVLVGYGRVPSSMGTRNPFSRGVRFCPLKPVEISTLITQQAERRFKILDAVFEQEGDKLYVRHARDPTWDESAGDAVGYVTRCRSPWQRLIQHSFADSDVFFFFFFFQSLTSSRPPPPIPRKHLPYATQAWATSQTGKDVPLIVKFFALLVVAKSMFRSVSESVKRFNVLMNHFGVTRARRKKTRTNDENFVKQHVGVVDKVEMRFVGGVPRFRKVAERLVGESNGFEFSGVNDSSNERVPNAGGAGETANESPEAESVLTIDGEPLFGKAALRPGTILQIGGVTYEALRDVCAHA
jgi:hypothetical protein